MRRPPSKPKPTLGVPAVKDGAPAVYDPVWDGANPGAEFIFQQRSSDVVVYLKGYDGSLSRIDIMSFRPSPLAAHTLVRAMRRTGKSLREVLLDAVCSHYAEDAMFCLNVRHSNEIKRLTECRPTSDAAPFAPPHHAPKPRGAVKNLKERAYVELDRFLTGFVRTESIKSSEPVPLPRIVEHIETTVQKGGLKNWRLFRASSSADVYEIVRQRLRSLVERGILARAARGTFEDAAESPAAPSP